MTVSGEYWIDEDGDMTFCDGDAGVDVPNHAMVVVSHCCQLVIDALENVDQEHQAFASELTRTIEFSTDEGIVDCTMIRCSINDSIDYFVEDKLVCVEAAEDLEAFVCKITGLDAEIVNCAFGQHSDPRVLGTTRFNWVRVIGSNFDVAKLDRSTCKRMADFAIDQEHDNWTVEVSDHNGKRLLGFGLTIADLESPAKVIRAIGNKALY